MALMSPSEYAKHRGISKVAVFYAIRDNRISTVPGPGKRRLIDSDLADKQWEQNTNHENRRNVKEPFVVDQTNQQPFVSENITVTQKVETENIRASQVYDEPIIDEPPRISSAPKDDPSVPSYAKSRAVKEVYNARLTKLEFDIRTGKYVLADDVKKAGFKIARVVRDNLLNIPDRIAGQIAAETDQFKCHQILKEEITKSLEGLTDLESLYFGE